MKNQTERRASERNYYVDGNTVRRMEAVPDYRRERREREEREREEQLRRRKRQVRRNQERKVFGEASRKRRTVTKRPVGWT